MQFTLDINLDEEQQAAFQATVDRRNAASGTNVTVQQHLQEVVNAHILQRLEEFYRESLSRMGELFATKPYDVRKAVIANLEELAQQ